MVLRGCAGAIVAWGRNCLRTPPGDRPPSSERQADLRPLPTDAGDTGGEVARGPAPPLILRVKRRLLGPALATERLTAERLGRPSALAVFASDNLSSVAYATEEMLRVLVPALGAAAFGFVLPVSAGVLVVLGLLVVSYRQTLAAYPGGGGAYTVSRENLGVFAAQVAGAALGIDYVLTASVSVAAGVAALYSALPALQAWRVPIALAGVGAIAYANLRGLRESARAFALPVFGFLLLLGAVVAIGLVRLAAGSLPVVPSHLGAVAPLDGLALAWVVLRSFSSGGSALTGVEAISNGVGAFRPPEARNACSTLVVMAGLLGSLFFGVSVLAVALRVVPAAHQTVLSEIARAVLGSSVIGRGAWLVLQALTAGILVLAANTAFADFPRLAAVMAADRSLPGVLARRGHRLVHSSGIVLLAGASMAVLTVFGASVDRLIPLYALGVFVSFSLSQAGMVRHHLSRRQSGWRAGVAANAAGAATTTVVAVVVVATKFVAGAWIVALAIPAGAVILERRRRSSLAAHAALRASAEELRAQMRAHHQVVVLVEELHAGVAEALRYARALDPLGPDDHQADLVALHVATDPAAAERLKRDWAELGIEVELMVVACPDRDIAQALTAWLGAHRREDRELTVLLPVTATLAGPGHLARGRAGRAISRAVRRLGEVRLVVVPARPTGRRRK